MKNKIIKIVLLIFLLIFFFQLVPIFARCGSWKELKRWEAPVNTFDIKRSIYLSLEETFSYFNIFHGHKNNRLKVTDGGYAFMLYFEIPHYPSKEWIDGCNVKWTNEGVALISESGLSFNVTKEAVLKQIGR